MGISAMRTDLIQCGERLEYFTILWNSVEALLSVGAGIAAGSIALVGFGLDSFIEMISGSALLWRMKADQKVDQRERAERISLRIVGVCFLALAAYVAIDSIYSLLHKSGRILAVEEILSNDSLALSYHKFVITLTDSLAFCVVPQNEYFTT
jgi:divalent metal cation (Fe/Co/Zn/Cd) transporter